MTVSHEQTDWPCPASTAADTQLQQSSETPPFVPRNQEGNCYSVEEVY